MKGISPSPGCRQFWSLYCTVLISSSHFIPYYYSINVFTTLVFSCPVFVTVVAISPSMFWNFASSSIVFFEDLVSSTRLCNPSSKYTVALAHHFFFSFLVRHPMNSFWGYIRCFCSSSNWYVDYDPLLLTLYVSDCSRLYSFAHEYISGVLLQLLVVQVGSPMMICLIHSLVPIFQPSSSRIISYIPIRMSGIYVPNYKLLWPSKCSSSSCSSSAVALGDTFGVEMLTTPICIVIFW